MRPNDSITCHEMNMQMLHLQKGQAQHRLCEDRAQLGTAAHTLPPLPGWPKPSGSTQRMKAARAAIPPWKGLLDCWARVRCSSLSRYTGWCWLISTLVHTLLSPCRKKVNEQDKCSLQRQQQKRSLKYRISNYLVSLCSSLEAFPPNIFINGSNQNTLLCK